MISEQSYGARHSQRHLTRQKRRVALRRDVLDTKEEQFEPVSLKALKDHLVIDHNDDDSLLDDLRATAVYHFEDITSHYLVKQTRQASYDGAPPCWKIPARPFVSLTKVESIDQGTATDEGNTDNFYVTESNPARVCSKRGTSIEHPHQQIRITYVAGYASQDEIPPPIVTAIKKMVADLYEYRTSKGMVEDQLEDLPFKWKELLQPHKLIWL